MQNSEKKFEPLTLSQDSLRHIFQTTKAWSSSEKGLYFSLLIYESAFRAIPDNITSLSRITGADRRTVKKFWETRRDLLFAKNPSGGYESILLKVSARDQIH